jgi:hypothetical protein
MAKRTMRRAKTPAVQSLEQISDSIALAACRVLVLAVMELERKRQTVPKEVKQAYKMARAVVSLDDKLKKGGK